MRWGKTKDGWGAIGRDGTAYRVHREPVRVEVVTADGEVPLIDQTWRNVDEAKWWCEERDLMQMEDA